MAMATAAITSTHADARARSSRWSRTTWSTSARAVMNSQAASSFGQVKTELTKKNGELAAAASANCR